MATNPRKNRLTHHALDGSFLYPDDHGDWVPFAEALAIKRERDALAARVDYLENRLGLTTMDEEGEKVELPEEFDGVAWRDRLNLPTPKGVGFSERTHRGLLAIILRLQHPVCDRWQVLFGK